MSQILVINSGSSSLKYAEFEVTDRLLDAGARRSFGRVEQIGDPGSGVHHTRADGSTLGGAVDIPDHAAALAAMRDALTGAGDESILAVAHRVVHGAELFTSAVLVDDAVEHAIEQLAPLAPLHNPANLAGIRAARATYPDASQVAVFDTAFHATMPPLASTYAVPVQLAQAHRVRRWGFQGTSCSWVSRSVAEALGKPLDELQLIICHLGSGASVTAVRDGRSVDTSMGMTPLEGLVMGTRSGDIDAAVVTHLMDSAGLTGHEVLEILTRHSGLLALGGDDDMRVVRERAVTGDAAAALALEVYAHRVRKYIGAFLTQLPELDAVAFTAGVGEHDALMRRDILAPLRHLGLDLDEELNACVTEPGAPEVISSGGPALMVVPTDEELEIARQTLALLR